MDGDIYRASAGLDARSLAAPVTLANAGNQRLLENQTAAAFDCFLNNIEYQRFVFILVSEAVLAEMQFFMLH